MGTACTDLHKIGGLNTLLDLLECDQPSLRWRAAEVVATCMANNPPVQQVSWGVGCWLAWGVGCWLAWKSSHPLINININYHEQPAGAASEMGGGDLSVE